MRRDERHDDHADAAARNPAERMLVGDEDLVPNDLFRMFEPCTRKRSDFAFGQVAIGGDEKSRNRRVRMPACNDVADQCLNLPLAELLAAQFRLQGAVALGGRDIVGRQNVTPSQYVARPRRPHAA